MNISLSDNIGNERESNTVLAEYQAYIIDRLITSFDETITHWIVNCGYDENTVRLHRWSEIGTYERHMYAAPLVDFARRVAWTHI